MARKFHDRKSGSKYATVELCTALLDYSHEGVFILDTNQQFIDVNPFGATMLEYSRDEILKLSLPDLIPPEDVEQINLCKLEIDKSLTTECRLRHRNGNLISMAVVAKRLSDGNYLVIFSRISKRSSKQDQTKLKNLEEIANHSPAIAFHWRAAEGWPVEFVSDNIQQFGYTPSDFYSGRVPFASIVHPDDLERVAAEVNEYSQMGSTDFPQEYRIITADKQICWVDDRTWIQRDAKGRVLYYQGIIFDITERKKAEEAVQESEHRFRTLAEASFEGIGLSKQGVLLDLNDQLAQMLGYQREELLGTLVMNCVAPEHRELVAGFMRSGRQESYEHLAQRKDGTIFPVEIRVRTTRIGDADIRITAIRDITERKRAEETLIRQTALFKNLFDRSPEAITIVDQEDRVMNVNRSFETLFGYREAEAQGHYINDLIVSERYREEAEDITHKSLEDGQIVERETIRCKKDGHPVDVSMVGYPIVVEGWIVGGSGIYRDITERKQAEEQLRQLNRKDEQALRVAKMGHWEFDVPSGVFTFNDQYYTLHGTTAKEVGGYQMTAEDFARRLVHPEDAPGVGENIHQAIVTTDPDFETHFEGRILKVNGEARWVMVWFRIVKDAEGNTVKLYGVNQDIDERKRAEEALRNSQQMLLNSLDQFPGVVFWKDRQSVYLGCNRAFSTGAGFANPEDIIGKTDFDCPWAETEAIAYRADDSAVMSSGQSQLGIIEPQHQADGRVAWFDTSKVPLIDEQGYVFGVLGASRDITAQMNTLETLRETEFFLNRSQEVARIGSYKFDVAMGHWINSPSLDTIFGIDDAFPRTVDGWLSLIAPEDRDMMQTHLLQHVLVEHHRFEKEYRIIRQNDQCVRWVHGLGELEFDEHGNTIKMIGTIQDITERKQGEFEREQLIAELEIKNAESEILRESAAAVAYPLEFNETVSKILDQLKRVVPYDSASVHLLIGNELEIIGGRGFPEGKDPRGMRFVLDENDPSYPILRDGLPYVLYPDIQVAVKRFKGFYVDHIYSWMAIPLHARGRLIGMFAVDGFAANKFTEAHARFAATFANQVAIALENARLYAELQEKYAELQKLLEELETKNAELERFTYTVSHDLKSPLVTIKGFLGYIEQDAATSNTERLKGDIRRISDAVETMRQLLNDLLEFSRVGRIINPSETISFEELAREAVALVQGGIMERNIEVRIASGMPAVFGDKRRLLEVLQNLIDNAAKFMGGQKSPQIEIGWEGEKDEKSVFFVRDNGVGIAPRYHEQVFGLFNKLNPDVEGTGIGLTLAKRIVEVHDGRIWVESEVGKGATFYFTLPKG